MLAVNSSLSRSSLIIVVLINAISPDSCAAKNKKENDDSWIVPTTLGLVGGVLVGSAITAWCKNAEINDIDYRPLTSLQELDYKIAQSYSHLLNCINASGTHFYDFTTLKNAIRNQLPYDSFISDLEKYEHDIREARKQLKNQIKYWDARLQDGYTEARNILAKTKITYQKLQALRRLAQEMAPLLQLEEMVQCIKYNSYLHYDELKNTPKQDLEITLINAAHKNTGKKLISSFPLIAFAECLQEYSAALLKAIKSHKKHTSQNFDQKLHKKALEMLDELEHFQTILTQSIQYKSEIAYKKETEHRQKIQRELEEQTRLARKQSEYEREQLRYAREQRDTQLRTEQQIAMLRLENAVRDLYS